MDCDLSVCGNMAEDKKMLLFFMGLGIRKFSVDPVKIPELQEYVSRFSIEEAEEHTRALLKMATVRQVRDYFHHLPD